MSVLLKRFRLRPVFLISGLVVIIFAFYTSSHPTGLTSRLHKSPSASCHPYSLPGHLVVSNKANPHAIRWTPFKRDCPAPALFASVLRASWAAQAPTRPSIMGEDTSWTKQSLGPDGREWEDVSWAKNATILIMGDSVMRFNTNHFCEASPVGTVLWSGLMDQLAGEQMIEVTYEHPWSGPKPEITVDYPGSATAKAKRGVPEGMNPGQTHNHRPHYCHLPGLDLLVIQTFNIGLDDFGSWIWKEGAGAAAAYTFEERMQKIVNPIVENSKTVSGRSAAGPVLTYVQSCLWDAARFMKEDVDGKADVETGLSNNRLQWYRDRVRAVLLATREMYPRTHIEWLTTHYPIKATKGWFVDEQPTPNRLDRLSELNAAAVSAITDNDVIDAHTRRVLADVSVNTWGQLMIGQQASMFDGLHPGWVPGGYLFSDMMMWDLRQAVTSSRWW